MSVYGRAHSHGVVDAATKDAQDDDDDWETDPDYVNDVSEQEQRKGSKLINPNQVEHTSMSQLREKVIEQDSELKKKEYENKKVLYGGERAANSQKN